MKLLRLLAVVLFAFALAMPETADAQIGRRVRDRIKNRAEDKVNREADRQADRLVDRSEDAVRDAVRSSTEARMNEIMSSEPKPVELGAIERGDADADFVSYRQATRLHFPGATGGMASLLNRFGAVDEHIRMHDGKKRADNRDQSTIDDAEAAHTLILYHERKQWSRTTYGELAEAIEGLNQADGDRPSEGEMPSDALGELKLSVERRGPSGDRRGVPTEQVVLIMEGEYEAEMEDGDVERGKLFIVTDMKVSDAVAGRNLIRVTEQAIARAMGQAFQGTDLGQMLGVWGNDPRITGSLKAAAEEMEKVTGFPVETDVYMVQASLDHQLDVDQVLSGEMARPEDMEAMQRGDRPSGQYTMFRVTTAVGDLTTEPFDTHLMDRPADYEEVEDNRAQMWRDMNQANRTRRN